MEDPKSRLKELRQEITKLNDAYYNQNKSLVSDQEYDKLLKELQKLEEEHPELRSSDSPTQTVGHEVKFYFQFDFHFDFQFNFLF